MAMWNPWRGCHRYSEGCKYCYIHKVDAKRGVDTNAIVKTDNFSAPVAKNKKGDYCLHECLINSSLFLTELYIFSNGSIYLTRMKKKLIAVIESETNRIESMSYCDFQNDLIKMLGESSTKVVTAKPHGDYQAEMIVDIGLLEGDALKDYVSFVCGLLQLKYPHEEPTFYYVEHDVIEKGYWLYNRKLATVRAHLGYCK